MNARTWMFQNVDDFTDKITGEVNESGMAEWYCDENGIDPDGDRGQRLLDIAYQIARAHEYKTGAREPRIRSDIGEFFNHVDSNFNLPKVK